MVEASREGVCDKETIKSEQKEIDELFNFVDDKKVMMEKYDKAAEKYEGWMDAIKFADPVIVAQQTLSRLENKDAHVIDFGCGAGAIGKVFKDHGFNNLIGLDASQGMIDVAVKEKVYSEAHKIMLGEDPFPEAWIGKFDAAVSSGCFNLGHFPSLAFDLMLDSLKVGGLCVFSITQHNIDNLYKEKITEVLEVAKRAEALEHVDFTKYPGLTKEDGIGIMYEKKGNVLVWRKLK